MLTGNEVVDRIRRAAEEGEALPDPNTPMGVTLHALADQGGEAFDRRFAKEISALRPDWFDGDAVAFPGRVRRMRGGATASRVS